MKTPSATLTTTTTNKAPPKKSSSRRSKKSYNGVTLPTDSTERRRLRNKLSAQVFRKRKQDALKTAKEDVDECDEEMDKLNVQLNDTRSRISQLQSTMKAIEEQLGPEMVQHILQQCNMTVQCDGIISTTSSTMIVTSDSETNDATSSSSLSLSSSSDDEYNL